MRIEYNRYNDADHTACLCVKNLPLPSIEEINEALGNKSTFLAEDIANEVFNDKYSYLQNESLELLYERCVEALQVNCNSALPFTIEVSLEGRSSGWLCIGATYEHPNFELDSYDDVWYSNICEPLFEEWVNDTAVDIVEDYISMVHDAVLENIIDYYKED